MSLPIEIPGQAKDGPLMEQLDAIDGSLLPFDMVAIDGSLLPFDMVAIDGSLLPFDMVVVDGSLLPFDMVAIYESFLPFDMVAIDGSVLPFDIVLTACQINCFEYLESNYALCTKILRENCNICYRMLNAQEELSLQSLLCKQ